MTETLQPPNIDPPVHSKISKSRPLPLFSVQDLLETGVLEVTSQELAVSAAQVPNKYASLVYPFRFCGNTHRILLNTGAN